MRVSCLLSIAVSGGWTVDIGSSVTILPKTALGGVGVVGCTVESGSPLAAPSKEAHRWP